MNRIKKLREAAGLSSNELAARVGTSGAQMSRLENGERRLTVEWMQRIAKALGCKPSDLIELATLADFDNDVEAHVAGDVGSAQDALKARGMAFFRVVTDVLEQHGLAPGAIILVDRSESAIAAARTGDAVLAEVISSSGDVTPSRVMLRQFIFPSLLVTNRRTGNTVVPLQGSEIECRIVGVVVPAPGS